MNQALAAPDLGTAGRGKDALLVALAILACSTSGELPALHRGLRHIAVLARRPGSLAPLRRVGWVAWVESDSHSPVVISCMARRPSLRAAATISGSPPDGMPVCAEPACGQGRLYLGPACRRILRIPSLGKR